MNFVKILSVNRIQFYCTNKRSEKVFKALGYTVTLKHLKMYSTVVCRPYALVNTYKTTNILLKIYNKLIIIN